MRRYSAPLWLALTVALSLAACGGDAESASGGGNGDAGIPAAPRSDQGSVAGKVTLSTREDYAGIAVSLQSAADEESRGTTLTDAQGRYFFGELSAGSYVVSATLPAFETAKSQAFEVKSGKATAAPTLTLQPRVGNVHGKVRLQGRTDHAGALVRVVDSTLQSVTDAEGKFALAEVPAGTHVLRISAEGYRERSSEYFAVEADPVDVGTLVLEQARGNLVGSATRAGDQDHSGILVTLEGSSYSAVTGPTGAYVLRDIPVGQYAVVASYPDYQAAHASDQQVQADGMTAVPNLVLTTNPGSIRGVVTLGGGGDHSGTLVTLVGTGLSAQTDATGAFAITGVRAGLHSVTGSHDAYEPASSPVFTVMAGQEVQLTAFGLSRSQGSVGGKIVLSGGSDFGGVQVELTGTSHAVTTTSSGAFFFSNVDTGVYEVRARASGYTDTLSQGVLVQRNQSTDLGTLTLSANPGSIVGSAFKDGAANHSGILVSVVGSGLSAVTASNGSYAIAAVPAGLHSVTATLAGYDEQSSSVFSVAAGAQTSLSALTLRASRGGLVGSVSLSGQTDHGGVLIEVVGTAFSTTSNSAGAYTLQNLPVGTYEVRASRAGFVSASSSSVTVVASVTSAVAALTLAANPGRIMGRILKEGATDHTGILVTVNGTSYTGSSAADGSFEILGMPGGVYSVSASAAGFARYDFPLVVVSAGQSTTVGDAQLLRVKGPIHGVVTLQGRSVHSAVLVELLGSAFFTTSAADGSFELNVPTGNYAGLRFSMPQFVGVTLTQTITVTENGVANLAPVELAALSNDVRGSVTLYGRLQHDGVQIKLTGLVGQSTQGLTFTTSSLADGSFALSSVPLGSYDVAYSYAAGWGSLVRSVSVVPGAALLLPAEQLRETYVYINGDAALTTTRSTTLSLNYSDCYQMRIGHIADVSDGTWQPCAASSAWTLTAGDGMKTVYAKFRDGNLVESPIVSDTIRMKSSATIVSVSHDASGPLGRGDKVHLTLSTAADTLGSATFDIAGYDSAVKLYDDGTHGDVTANDGIYELDYQAFESVDVNNAVVTGHFTDRYGNVAAPVNASSAITVSVPPLVSDIQVVPDLATGNATISWNTDDPAQATLQWGPTQFYGTTQSSTLLLNSQSFAVGAGGLLPSTEYHYRITATDAAGNVTVTNDRSFFMQPNPPSMVIAIPGAGRFDVRWEAPPQDNIVGYNVYRALVPGGPYTKLNASGPYIHPALFYSDLTVTNGTAYHYVVTAVDVLGNESVRSVEVSGRPTASHGPTYVQGAITGTTVWSSSGSPYIVTGSIAVEPGAVLAIGPGVSVLFDGWYFLRVDGQLVSLGAESASVRLTSGKSVPAPGDWRRLEIRGASPEGRFDSKNGAYLAGNVMSETQVEYAGETGIVVTDSGLTLLDSTISFNERRQGTFDAAGVTALRSDLLIARSTIQANAVRTGVIGVGGVRSEAGYLVMVDSEVTENLSTIREGVGGVSVDGGQAVLTRVNVAGNQATGGQYCVGGLLAAGVASASLTVVDSIFAQNTSNCSGVSWVNAGGALVRNSGSVGSQAIRSSFSGTLFESNTSTAGAGAVGVFDTSTALVGCTLSGNSGPNGASYASAFATLTVIGCEFDKNTGVIARHIASQGRTDGYDGQLVLIANQMSSSPSDTYGAVSGFCANCSWNRVDASGSGALVRSIGTGTTQFVSNTFTNTAGRTAPLFDTSSLPSGTREARFNYWGTEVTADMDAAGASSNIAAIYDYYDDVELTRVDYSGWVHSAYPLARIASPSWGLSFAAGETISLSGSANDLEDGNLAGNSLSWSSETDGPLGTGRSLNVSTLSVGTHRIWLTGIDGNGQEGKVYTEIEILAP